MQHFVRLKIVRAYSSSLSSSIQSLQNHFKFFEYPLQLKDASFYDFCYFRTQITQQNQQSCFQSSSLHQNFLLISWQNIYQSFRLCFCCFTLSMNFKRCVRIRFSLMNCIAKYFIVSLSFLCMLQSKRSLNLLFVALINGSSDFINIT